MFFRDEYDIGFEIPPVIDCLFPIDMHLALLISILIFMCAPILNVICELYILLNDKRKN